MEATQQVLMGSNDHKEQNNMMLKGKRTKRQRPQSPIPFTMPANSSSTKNPEEGIYANQENNDNNNFSFSPPASPDRVYQDDTEEEEDMANCLILLAQGCYSKQPHRPKQLDEDAKFTSRRYLEAATSNGGKAGYYVYECKTCSRTFPSFQALGGHRTSHKKAKNVAVEEKERRHFMTLSSSEDQDAQFRSRNFPSLSLQLSNRGLYNSSSNNYNNNSSNNIRLSKTHECSICGAEFNSGQALGGHMRRHRGPGTTPTITSTALSLTPMASDSEEQVPKRPKNALSLDLDLNLPAPEPEDDHQKASKFSFASKQQYQQQQQQQQQQKPQQQTHLVFPPPLVDCHY